MPLGQGFLNAWVKVNSKHVVIPPTNKSDRDESNHPSKNSVKRSGGAASVTTARTANTNEDEETRVIHYNNRQNRRRLHRTVSASDLLRDKAKGEQTALDKSNSSKSASGPGKLKKDAKQANEYEHSVLDTPSSKAQHEEKSVVSETDGSLRFVAGFFGADIESVDPTMVSRSSDHYSKETASTQQMGPFTQIDAGSVISRGDRSLPTRASPRKVNNNSNKGGGMGIRFPPNIFAPDNHMKGNCSHCMKLKDELLAAREDLEYLRGVALRNEYTRFACQKDPSKESKNDEESPAEGRNSQDTLNEVVVRHKTQLEKLKREGAFQLHDLHEKLHKYSSLCKDLNEEAEFRNEEALKLHSESNAVRIQRDEMATELEELRARVTYYERNEQERRKSELILQDYEQNGLDGVDQAIQTRDTIIADLAGRLERALDCLDLEREQQRQRRQIIFPTQRTSQSTQRSMGDKVGSELKDTKDALRKYQHTVESLRRENERLNRQP